MKKLFTLLVVVASSSALLAQTKVQLNNGNQINFKPQPAGQAQVQQANEQGARNLQEAETFQRGNGFVFNEDFSNGLNGNNPFGAWTTEDTGNNTIWMMATAQSPAGFYSGTNQSLNSTTKTNGWVIFDADLYQGGEITAANPAEAVSGYLTSPVIDMSSLASVIVEYQQVFRYCCADDDPFVLEVSNDGGQNWFVYNAAPTWTGGINTLSANPLITRVDISGAAAGQSNVRIRWGWQPVGNSTHSHYFWGLDDIKIYENPVVNDVQVTYVSTGDIFNDYEYRAIPLNLFNPSALGGMIVGTIYSNVGTNPQTGTFTAEILAADQTTVLASVTEVLELVNAANQPNPADNVDTLYIATNWAPTALGEYWVRTTVSIGNTDETPLNNTAKKKFTITSDEYGHNDATINNGNMEPWAGAGTAASPYLPHGYGSYFSIPQSGSTAHGITVRFDNTCSVGIPVVIGLVKRNTSYQLSDGEYVASNEFDVAANWRPNNAAQSFPYYLPFDAPAVLESGNNYFAGILTEAEGSQRLTIQSTPEIDRDFSTGIYAQSTGGSYLWFFGLIGLGDHSPAVRLITSQRVGIEEAEIDLQSFIVSPNPAKTEARISFALAGSKYIAYEVRDMSGKLIEWKNAGQFAPGTNYINLDVTQYAAGNYFVNLVVDGKNLYTQKMNVVK